MRLTTILLTLTFLIPAPLWAQVASTSAEAAVEDTAVVVVPIIPFLEHSSTTAYGVFVASPLDDTTVWMYQPFDEPIALEKITPHVDLTPSPYTSFVQGLPLDEADTADAQGAWSTTTATFTLASTTGQSGSAVPVAVIQNISYTYDANGNITALTDQSGTGAGKSVTYTYDDLNRLLTANTSTASSTPYTHSYAYNALGNFTTNNGTSYSYAGTNYANPHAPTTIGANTYTYDNAGNMLTGAGKTNTWDWRNRLVTSAQSGATSTYAYDHASSRVKQIAGGTTTYYPFKTYNVTNDGKVTKHIFANGEMVASLTTANGTTTTEYIHADHLGSMTASTDYSQGVTEYTDYYPYGAQRLSQSYTNSPEQRKYIGQEFDTATQLSYLNARYYNGAQGQFVSEDPVFWEVGMTQDGKAVMVNPQAMNSYAYANDNPVTVSDPSGRVAPVLAILGMAAVAYFTDASMLDQGVENPDPAVEQNGRMVQAGLFGLSMAGGSGKAKAVVNGVETTAEAASFLSKGDPTDVYLGVKKGKDVYVGISKNIARRAQQHGERFDKLATVASMGTRNQARAVEQFIKGENPQYQNKINSISPSALKAYSQVVAWAKEVVEKMIASRGQ